MHMNPPKLSMFQVLACGAAIVTLSMGIRHGFGLWLLPITQEMGWTRQSFAWRLRIQNLSWGVIGIFAGMAADRFGAFRVLMGGAVLYGLGLAGMALSPTPTLFALTAGVLIGAAQAGTTYAVIYGVLGRQIAPERRSWAMGVAAAAGSFGQFLMVPVEGWLIAGLGWQQALLALSLMVLLIVPLAFGLREPTFAGAAPAKREQTIVQALGEAFRYPSFNLLMAGLLRLRFPGGVHRCAHAQLPQGPRPVAPGGQLCAGADRPVQCAWHLRGRHAGPAHAQAVHPAFIYFARAAVITVFLLVPLSPLSVYVFSAVMGTLWLSTIPPTNATIAQIFGVQHLSMLGGFVFFSHQIGSFLGVWLGGYLYDATGSYDIVWYIAIGLGVLRRAGEPAGQGSPIQRGARPTRLSILKNLQSHYCR